MMVMGMNCFQNGRKSILRNTFDAETADEENEEQHNHLLVKEEMSQLCEEVKNEEIVPDQIIIDAGNGGVTQLTGEYGKHEQAGYPERQQGPGLWHYISVLPVQRWCCDQSIVSFFIVSCISIWRIFISCCRAGYSLGSGSLNSEIMDSFTLMELTGLPG